MDSAVNSFAAAATGDCPSARDAGSLKGPGARLRARRRLYGAGWKAAYLIVANIGDHVEAIADTATPTSPRVFAHMTLARSALEGAARLSYLLHPKGNLEDRLLRAACVLLLSAEEEMRAAPQLKTVSDDLGDMAIERAADRHSDILSVIELSGIVVSRGKRDQVTNLSWADAPSQMVDPPNVTSLLKGLLPNRPAAYNVGSGVAHSLAWALDTDLKMDLDTDSLQCSFDPFALAGSVDLAICASILVIETFATMLGGDPASEVFQARTRERAVSLQVQALR